VDWDAVDPLFEGPPDAFVAARNALAKELRAAGEREVAAEVAKLRRPTATAYALNQVARHQPAVLAEALEARAVLRAATEGAGQGRATDLREATTADRAATRALVAVAREVLGSEDAGLAQRITGTLLAAVLDDEVGAALRAGRLTAEQDASALAFATSDDMAPVVSLAEHAAERTARRARAARPKGEGAAPTRAADRAAEEKAARAAAKAAEEAERARRREQAEREQAVDRLERRVRRLDGKVAEAEEALAAAREERDAAEDELQAARAALEGST
jgi:hypothetical protein